MQLEKLNHFEKFNFETKFEINNDELESRYLKLQQEFHPDTAKDPVTAEINSILINQAYLILKNPLKRAIYLLQLQDINIDSEECIVKPSQETLMFIMELREEISESSKPDQIKQKIKELIAEEMQNVADLLIEKKYQDSAQALIKAKYLDKIIFDLKK